MAIEQRITAALTNRDIKSDALAELIAATEAAIAAAEKAAEAERAKALDPLQSPDADAAHAAMQSAEFAAQRLLSVLPRLQAKYRQVAGAEQYAEWAATFDALRPRHAAAAEKLREAYALVPQLVAALVDAKAVDAEVHTVMQKKPYLLAQSNGDNRSLGSVEATARGLAGGVNADFSIMKLKLPAFDAPNKLLWPPPEFPWGVQVAAALVPVGDPRLYGPRWHEVHAERDQQQKQAERDAAHHGPRWWERTGS